LFNSDPTWAVDLIDDNVLRQWKALEILRNMIVKKVEQIRRNGEISKNSDASVTVVIPYDQHNNGAAESWHLFQFVSDWKKRDLENAFFDYPIEIFLCHFFNVSQFSIQFQENPTQVDNVENKTRSNP